MTNIGHPTGLTLFSSYILKTCSEMTCVCFDLLHSQNIVLNCVGRNKAKKTRIKIMERCKLNRNNEKHRKSIRDVQKRTSALSCRVRLYVFTSTSTGLPLRRRRRWFLCVVKGSAVGHALMRYRSRCEATIGKSSFEQRHNAHISGEKKDKAPRMLESTRGWFCFFIYL